MRDAGVPSRREKAKAANELSVAAQKNFLENWCEDNEQNFCAVMDLIKDGAPVQYARLYLEAKKLTMARESNINININRQQDRENLQALVRARMPLPENGSFTPYEEVKPKEIVMRWREE